MTSPQPARSRATWRTAGLLVACAAALLAVMTCLGELDVHVLWHGPVGAEDRLVDSALARDRTGFLNVVTAVCTDCAETLTVIAAGAFVVAAAWWAFRRWREPLFVAAALLGEVSIFVLTTLLVHRPRPAVAHLETAPPTSSFPSGHTAAATVLYGAIAILVTTYGARRRWRTIAMTLAVVMPVIVATSRLYRGMHYLSDVIAGLVLGAGWLFCATTVLLRGAPARAAITRPTAESGRWSAAGARSAP